MKVGSLHNDRARAFRSRESIYGMKTAQALQSLAQSGGCAQLDSLRCFSDRGGLGLRHLSAACRGDRWLQTLDVARAHGCGEVVVP